MLASGHPRMLLCVMRPMLPLSFFWEHTPPLAAAPQRLPVPAAVLARESMCIGPSQLHAREREHSAYTHVLTRCMLHHGGPRLVVRMLGAGLL